MRLCLLRILAATVFAAPASVYAGTIHATLNNLSPVSSVDIKHDATAGSSYTDGVVYNGIGGRFNWTLNSTSGTLLGNWSSIISNGGAFYSFCIQLNQEVGYGANTFTEATLGSIFDATRVDQLGKLYASSYNNGDFTTGPGTTADINAAGFQLAVWEIVQDADAVDVLATDVINLKNGVFQAYLTDPTIINAAAAYLKAAYDSPTAANLIALTDYNSNLVQDQVIAISLANAPPTVPLPGAAAAAVPILMLGGTTLKSKRRRRQAEESAL